MKYALFSCAVTLALALLLSLPLLYKALTGDPVQHSDSEHRHGGIIR